MSDSALTFRVSVKGAVSVYGLGRFPVTLYAEQWTKLMNQDLVKFLDQNKAKLAEQQQQYLAAKAVAVKRGITDEKEQDKFIRQVLGYSSETATSSRTSTAKAELVAQIEAKLDASSLKWARD